MTICREENDVAFSVPVGCTVLFFGVPTKMQLTPRSLATNSSGSSKSYRTRRASPLLDDEIASRKSALTQCWLINSAVRVNAAPLPHVKRPLLLRAQLE